ncbi:hypothetical protein SLEP1_g32370 [Rubroshorea leprosula]|uniref:MATH domain-containing protein n=1 Tax=Rubroshorea leprosula TaxID=152421 RepID=A0AAV5KDA6_9ROSI|nr:hypothetical protein SLEP1_g32370 [Rubroshorea leprosula]
MEVGEIKFTWKIKNFSKLDSRMLYSNVFSLEDYKWRILVYPKGNNKVDHLSIYLDVADSATLPSGWSRNAEFSLTVVNQIDNNSSVRQATEHKFCADEADWGFTSFIPLKELHDLGRGYLVEDTCIIKANVTVFRDESHGSSKEARNEIANGCKVAIRNSTKEDIDAFFVDLESEISSINNLSSKVGEEALTVIRNTLNMDPADSNDPGRISQIKTAFDVLTSLDDYSVLTAEQKEELLNMKEKIVDFPERAAKAAKDKNLFMQKEFVKKTLGQKLGKSLIEFRKTKEEIEQQERQIANLQEQVDALLAQIGEAQKKKDNISSQQKEMFELSKDLKAELEVLEKQWPEYEAKKEAAEEEDKMVRTEWQKMRQFVSSLNKYF